MRIAVVVHGRFHAFDLARALLARGHDVRVFTNYPRWAAARFDLPPAVVESCWTHGLAVRAVWAAKNRGLRRYPEGWLHHWFGRWAALRAAGRPWDAVLAWSGVAEELFRALAGGPARRLLVRGSAHVRTQARLLEEERRRTGLPVDGPSRWIVAREEREYGLADRIVVLSGFCRDSFVAEGVPAARLMLLPLGARLDRFRAPAAARAARRRRLLDGAPLRILNVGAFSLRKGMWDMAAVLERLDPGRFPARFVGPVAPEARALAARLGGRATFVAPRPEAALPAEYAWGDCFVLPTIEDGFGVVLGQAAAAGLPVLTTPHSGGPDLVREGVTGWILPVRDPDAFAERLRWCDAHREAVAAMAERLAEEPAPWTWDRVAAAFEAAVDAGRGPGREGD
jgi:glycosyltransferase involved in cell wall biosynthesis